MLLARRTPRPGQQSSGGSRTPLGAGEGRRFPQKPQGDDLFVPPVSLDSLGDASPLTIKYSKREGLKHLNNFHYKIFLKRYNCTLELSFFVFFFLSCISHQRKPSTVTPDKIFTVLVTCPSNAGGINSPETPTKSLLPAPPSISPHILQPVLQSFCHFALPIPHGFIPAQLPLWLFLGGICSYLCRRRLQSPQPLAHTHLSRVTVRLMMAELHPEATRLSHPQGTLLNSAFSRQEGNHKRCAMSPFLSSPSKHPCSLFQLFATCCSLL